MDFEIGKDGKGGRFPLKTVMTEKSVCVLDDKGKIAKKITLKDHAKAAMSDDGMTMATLKGKEITISNLDEEIQGIVKIADPQPVVLPQHVSFELSPNGDYIVIISYFTYTIYFHNKKGKLLAQHDFDDLRGSKIKFSKDSRYVAVHVPNWGEGKTIGYLLFFNKKGKKLWEFDHKGCQARFDISSNGNFVVLTAEDKLYSLNKNGKVVYEKEVVLGDIDIALSGNGHYVAIAKTADHSVSLLDNRNSRPLWTYNISGFDPLNSPFTSLHVSGERQYVAVTISRDWTKRNKEGFLYIFNKSGNVVAQHTFKEYKIAVNLSHQGKMGLVQGIVNCYLYKL